MKTFFEEYELIKDKAMVIGEECWHNMSPEDKEKLKKEKTVIVHMGFGYATSKYKVVSNVKNLSDQECAIIADGGNLCFGWRKQDGMIFVHTD